MPLIMDEDSYMNELFGDADNVPLHTPAPPLKGLPRRIDELRANGCSQKLTWSNTGTVAWVSLDGRTVHFRTLARNPDDGKWQLAEEASLNIPHPQDDLLISHISWIPVGTDIVVIDSDGRIYIYSRAFGRMNSIRMPSPTDHEDELGAIVGMRWLAVSPHQIKNHVVWSASRRGDRWAYDIQRHAFNDPRHPYEMRPALICVTRNGIVKLLYQQPDDSWAETSKEVGRLQSTRDILTHASFASNSDHAFLMVTYSLSGRLQLYRVKIVWNNPQRPSQGQGDAQQQHMAQNILLPPPQLEITNLLSEDVCYPIDSMVDAQVDLTSDLAQRPSLPSQLTHLEILPKTPNGSTSPVVNNLTILAVFAHLPTLVPGLEQTQIQQTPHSTIVRWEVHHDQQSRLHSGVDQLASKKKRVGNVTQRTNSRLARQADIRTEAVVLSLSPIFYNTMISVCQSDSSIEFRDRSNLEVIGPDYSDEVSDFKDERVTSLPQAGFAFTSGDPTIHTALTANSCLALSLRSDGTPILRTMEYTHGNLGSDDDPKQGAAIAAIALQHCTACHQYQNSDDIFTLIKPDVSQNFRQLLRQQIWEAFRTSADVLELPEPQQWVAARQYPLHKSLSAQLLLGLSKGSARDLPAQVAWAVMNFRHACLAFSLIVKSPPAIIGASVPFTKRQIGLQTYIIQELLELAELLRPTPDFDCDTLNEKIQNSNSPALILVLASIPRSLLKILATALGGLAKRAATFISQPDSLETRNAVHPVHLATKSPAVPLDMFHMLIIEVSNSVKEAYKSSGTTEAERVHCENEMIIGGRVPNRLMPVVRRLLFQVLAYHAPSPVNGDAKPNPGLNLLAQVDIPRILFTDLHWLGMYPSPLSTRPSTLSSGAAATSKAVNGTASNDTPSSTNATTSNAPLNSTPTLPFTDIITGEEIRPRKTDRTRMCVRCGTRTEDLAPAGRLALMTKPAQRWAVNMGKSCICSGWWVVSDGEDAEPLK